MGDCLPLNLSGEIHEFKKMHFGLRYSTITFLRKFSPASLEVLPRRDHKRQLRSHPHSNLDRENN